MNRVIGIFVLASLVTACAPFKQHTLGVDAEGVPLSRAALLDSERLATPDENALLLEQIEPCYAFFGLKSAEATERAKRAWNWTLAGLISGAVIAPALTAANASANAAWIAGFSGFSGASALAINNANALGIGPASSVNGLIAVAKAVQVPMATASNVGKPFQERSKAAADASSICQNPYMAAGYVEAVDADDIKVMIEDLSKKVEKVEEAQKKAK